MRVILDNEFIRVEELAAERVVMVRRKPHPIPLADVPAVYAAAFATARPEYKQWGVVIDMRAVAGNNDPAFERAMEPVRRSADQAFARVVVLVKSMVGRMQIERTRRHDGTSTFVTQDEDEALALAKEASEDASFW